MRTRQSVERSRLRNRDHLERIEALRLLRSSNFNFLLVDDYVADMHVGEFVKRASQSLGRAGIFVMQTMPTENYIHFDGSVGPWPLVDKTNMTEVIRTVHSGC